MEDIDAIKVLNRRDTIEHLGISERNFQRLESRGEGPPKTRLSEGRVGYRVCDIKAWLDARRVVQPSARELIEAEGPWKPLGESAAKMVERLR